MSTSNKNNDGRECTQASTTPAQPTCRVLQFRTQGDKTPRRHQPEVYLPAKFLTEAPHRSETRRYLRLQLLYLAEELCELNEILTPDLPLET